MHQVAQEYASPDHDERHGARLGTPLRDDSLADVDGHAMEPPEAELRSGNALPGPSTGSKRDTASGSVSVPLVSSPSCLLVSLSTHACLHEVIFETFTGQGVVCGCSEQCLDHRTVLTLALSLIEIPFLS